MTEPVINAAEPSVETAEPTAPTRVETRDAAARIAALEADNKRQKDALRQLLAQANDDNKSVKRIMLNFARAALFGDERD